MNTTRKGPPNRISRLRIDGARIHTGIAGTSTSSIDERLEESTPLTNLRAEVDFSHYLGHPGLKGKTGKQKRPVGDTTEICSNRQRQDLGRKRTRHTPEDRIKLFAFRLAFIEKAASTIGTLAFLWATVVILGGFADSLTFTDFWVVTVIICAEALRIFTRSHELEWQMLKPKQGERSTSTISDPGRPASSVVDVESLSNLDDKNSLSSSTGMSFSFPESWKTYRNDDKQLAAVQVPPVRSNGPIHKKEPQGSPILTRGNVSILTPSVPVLSYLLKPQVMSRILYILELAFAVVCIALSVWRLSLQGFCYPGDEADTQSVDDKNKPQACESQLKSFLVSINLFYSMAVLEAFLFLIGRGYFEYRMRYRKLLSNVREKLFEEKLDATIFEKFYYTVYSTCLKSSIFDGLDMNFVTFGIEWLQSDDFEKQLHGAQLLNGFVSSVGKCDDKQDSESEKALRRLGTTPGIIERLVEMLSWNSPREEDLVGEIAAILCSLVAYGHYASRFAAVPGALQAVLSLLIPNTDNPRVGEEDIQSFTKMLDLRLKGLEILKHLCTSYANSLEIGETRGLLPVLVLFIQVHGSNAPKDMVSLNPDARQKVHEKSLRVYEESLKVLYFFAANKSTAGMALRQHIAGIVSVLKNLRDVIEDCNDKPYLQLLSMRILHQLALEENLRCSIGTTGGIIRLLFNLFRQNLEGRPGKVINALKDAIPVLQFKEPTKVANAFNNALSEISKEDSDQDWMEATNMSGELLSRLMLQNKDNCLTLLSLNVKDGNNAPLVDVMISFLHCEEANISAVSAAEILRSVLKYAVDSTGTEIAERSAPIVLQNIFNPTADTKSLIYEASLGLASRALESLSPVKYKEAFSEGIALSSREHVVQQLVMNLRHSPTTSKVPNVRRYSAEMIIVLVERDEYFRKAFARLDLKEKLEGALDSISELENFILVSGLTGCARHSEDMRPLLLRCIDSFNRSCRMRPKSSLGSA